MNKRKVRRFQGIILNWYACNGRQFRWRSVRDPYRVLVAEFLLQKTDVDKVKRVYGDFLRRWPSVRALSRARIPSIVAAIRPLGLRYKAARLKAVARTISGERNGRIPSAEDKLLQLPGVGRYIASAIRCFAFDRRQAVLDTNVIRILTRVFGRQPDRGRARDDSNYWDFAQGLVPARKAKEYNWGLLDFGSAVCKSAKPLCRGCPLLSMCLYGKTAKRKSEAKSDGARVRLTAVDLFAGAGGLSLGFETAGFEVVLAVEKDKECADTYRANRKRRKTEVIVSDISEVNFTKVLRKLGRKKGKVDILLCGAPCQGFSTSNMKTRTPENPENGLFREFLRAVEEITPKWVLFENVPGILDFERGEVVDLLNSELQERGYDCNWGILNSADYGVPQTRRRFFLVGNRMGIAFSFPERTHGQGKKRYVSVREAISDLPALCNGNVTDRMSYRYNGTRLTKYQMASRGRRRDGFCANNQVTNNSQLVLTRYRFIPPGGNWGHVPDHLMTNYKNKGNCHSGIYRRLRWQKPSLVLSNFRKCMLIHAREHRGLSVREAARLQSFPDRYTFHGPLGCQQQQVANAVPPALAEKIGRAILRLVKVDA